MQVEHLTRDALAVIRAEMGRGPDHPRRAGSRVRDVVGLLGGASLIAKWQAQAWRPPDEQVYRRAASTSADAEAVDSLERHLAGVARAAPRSSPPGDLRLAQTVPRTSPRLPHGCPSDVGASGLPAAAAALVVAGGLGAYVWRSSCAVTGRGLPRGRASALKRCRPRRERSSAARSSSGGRRSPEADRYIVTVVDGDESR